MKRHLLYILCIVALLPACNKSQKTTEDTYDQQKTILLQAVNAKINEQKARLGQLDSTEYKYKKQLDSTTQMDVKASLQHNIALLDSEKTDAQHRIQFFLMKQTKVQQMRAPHSMPATKVTDK